MNRSRKNLIHSHTRHSIVRNAHFSTLTTHKVLIHILACMCRNKFSLLEFEWLHHGFSFKHRFGLNVTEVLSLKLTLFYIYFTACCLRALLFHHKCYARYLGPWSLWILQFPIYYCYVLDNALQGIHWSSTSGKYEVGYLMWSYINMRQYILTINKIYIIKIYIYICVGINCIILRDI